MSLYKDKKNKIIDIFDDSKSNLIKITDLENRLNSNFSPKISIRKSFDLENVEFDGIPKNLIPISRATVILKYEDSNYSLISPDITPDYPSFIML